MEGPYSYGRMEKTVRKGKKEGREEEGAGRKGEKAWEGRGKGGENRGGEDPQFEKNDPRPHMAGYGPEIARSFFNIMPHGVFHSLLKHRPINLFFISFHP